MNASAPAPGLPDTPAASGLRALLFPLAIALAVGLDYFDNAAFSFFISDIAGGIGAPPDELIWSSSAYAVAGVLGILQHQWWVERVGHRHYIGLCLFLFAAAGLLAAFSQSSAELAVARALQGYLMGPMMGATRILIQLSFPPKDRGRATRLFLCSILLCSALAPLVGGYLVADFGWRAVFVCTVPVALLTGALVLLVVPATGRLPPEQRGEPHLWPYVIAALSLGALQVVAQQLRSSPFSESPGLEGMTLAGVLLLAGFIWHQWHHPRPLLHLHGLKEATFRTGLALYALYYFVSNAFSYLVSRFLQAGLGYPVENAGHLVGVTSLVSLAGALLYFRYAGRLPHKRGLIAVGFVLAALIGAWMAHMPPNVSQSWLLLPLTLRGLLLLFIALPVANLAFQPFALELYPHSYRIKNIVKQMAYSFSTATIIVLEQHRLALHQTQLAANASLSNPVFTGALDQLTQRFEQAGATLSAAHGLALAEIQRVVTQQANFMSFLDGFVFLGVISGAAALYALWQRRIL